MEYKVPIEMKVTFAANILLMGFGMIAGVDLMVAVSVVISVMLSCTMIILEAIYGAKIADNTETKTEPSGSMGE